MPVLISMLGLGVDLSIMYSIKAKLQMACDGAAVAAARALSLGQDTPTQTTMATNTAIQWFNANFAGGLLGATGTSVPTVTVTDTQSVRTVTVSATTYAPTYFMKYWGTTNTEIGATGQTARRNVVIMLVLDRSGSMNNPNNTYNGLSSCQVMVQGAKQFTGMFQEGRDQIGLITFGESVQIAQSPTTSFQTILGYANANGSAAGALDSINCVGGTNTPSGLSLGWNELYKMQLPGALNSILLFTDGYPTAGTFNFQSAMATVSGCLDGGGTAINAGGNMAANPRNWILNGNEGNSGNTVSFGANSFWNPVSGPVGALYGDLTFDAGIDHFFAPAGVDPTPYESQYSSRKTTTEAPGCAFTGNAPYGNPTPDIAYVPPLDIFGNSVNGYVTTGLTTINVNGVNQLNVDQTTIGNLVFNLADNAANFARSTNIYSNGIAMPGTLINTIGLGGNGGGIDFTLLQRIANDPNADPNGAYPAYPGYNQSQPVGEFTYSPDASQLQNAFMKIASMILRISK